eukprot:NODE_118_length_3051_cov_73.355677_g111_i0.p1 GENE.NODE_118_length_3051_cov_73.355677_g111_i0~~NODE_118_length_3051_cov_73.355677_g111_i0.p1  ORF type:complete len:958 (+),score=220.62 NODE_118_length_3051_cov_73.355677_g111_i0:58-2931(+)
MPPKNPDGTATHYSKGIRNIGDFNGSIRGMVVVNGGKEVWTAEHAGGISVRKGASGAVLNSIERKKDVLINCLASHGLYVWTGLSDGALRIYSIETCDLVLEIKQHAGPVNVIISHCGRIFTGGADWQIFAWDARSPEQDPNMVKALSQLAGHRNAVNCMAVDDRNLITGSDDCTIRCWDMDTCREAAAPWPLTIHKDSVNVLCVYEVYLFSAGTDNTIKVTNLQTGILIKTLELHHSPVKCLLKDPVGQRIWSGAGDGLIAVWDPKNLTLLTKMLDHGAMNMVTSISMLCRINAMKVWSVSADGTVKVWFSETEGPEVDYLEMNQMQEELQGTIEAMRGTIIQNYQELERRKSELQRLEGKSDRNKVELAVALGQTCQRQAVNHYYHKLLEWIAKRRRYAKRLELALALERKSMFATTSVYFSKWIRFSISGKGRQQRTEQSVTLHRLTDGGLASLYLKRLLDYSHLLQYKRKRRAIANSLQHLSEGMVCSRFLQKWRRWHDSRKLTRKHEYLSEAIWRSTERGVMSVYYQKLIAFTKREEEKERQLTVAAKLGTSNSILLIHRYYRAIVGFRKRTILKRKQAQAAQNLSLVNTNTLLQKYYRAWLAWRDQRIMEMMYRQVSELQTNMKQVKRSLRLEDNATIGTIEAHLSNNLSSGRRHKDELSELEQENRRLKQIYHPPDHTDIGAPSYLAEFIRTIKSLKSVCLNINDDFKEISETRAKIQHSSALTVFVSAFDFIQRLVEEWTGCEEGEQWPVDKDSIQHLSSSRLKTTLHNIREMVVCYDFMSMQDKEEVVSKDNLTLNLGLLVEFALASTALPTHPSRTHSMIGSAERGSFPMLAKPKKHKKSGDEISLSASHESVKTLGSKKSSIRREPKKSPSFDRRPSAASRSPSVFDRRISQAPSTHPKKAVHRAKAHSVASDKSRGSEKSSDKTSPLKKGASMARLKTTKSFRKN